MKKKSEIHLSLQAQTIQCMIMKVCDIQTRINELSYRSPEDNKTATHLRDYWIVLVYGLYADGTSSDDASLTKLAKSINNPEVLRSSLRDSDCADFMVEQVTKHMKQTKQISNKMKAFADRRHELVHASTAIRNRQKHDYNPYHNISPSLVEDILKNLLTWWNAIEQTYNFGPPKKYWYEVGDELDSNLKLCKQQEYPND